MQLSLNMYTTTALGLVMFYLGGFLKRKVRFLETFCIPAAVVGGLLFALLNLGLYVSGLVELQFDETLKTFFMTVFFTTVGFQADFRLLRSGGRALGIFTLLTVGLIVLQNTAGVSVAALLGVSPLLGMCTGSIPMVGGHGTAAAFGPILEEMGFAGATTFAAAAATFGLVVGSLMGGPVSRKLIRKHHLAEEGEWKQKAENAKESKEKGKAFIHLTEACFLLILAMGIGVPISGLIAGLGLTVPEYLGPMLVAAVLRNLSGKVGKFEVPMLEIEEISTISLTLFLGIAMITLKLWELAELALPLIILLGVQAVFMYLYTRFVVFKAMGSDYDAAVIVSGNIGFGMGATPNALANMQSVCVKYRYSEKAFLVIPIVGSLLADFINAGVITAFLNFIR